MKRLPDIACDTNERLRQYLQCVQVLRAVCVVCAQWRNTVSEFIRMAVRELPRCWLRKRFACAKLPRPYSNSRMDNVSHLHACFTPCHGTGVNAHPLHTWTL